MATVANLVERKEDPDPHKRWGVSRSPICSATATLGARKFPATRARKASGLPTLTRGRDPGALNDPDNLFRLNQNIPPA